MAQAELSLITYFAPIATFLIVFIITYAVLKKTEILGDNNGLNLFVSLLVASVFISAAGVSDYVQTFIPWIAVIFISLTFILAMTGFIGSETKFMNKGIGIAFLVLMGIIFLVSAFFVFSDILTSIIPGPGFGSNINPETEDALAWFYSPRIIGAVLLIGISAIVSWILVKAK